MNKIIRFGLPLSLVVSSLLYINLTGDAATIVGIPSTEVWLTESYGVTEFQSPSGVIQGQVSYNTVDQEIEVLFVDFSGVGQIAEEVSLAIQVSYWPTAISMHPKKTGEFIIAGYTQRGRTIMEKFKLENPTTTFSSLNTGPATKHISAPKVLRVTDVFESTDSELSQISDILWARHSQDEVFARFHSSARVYRINLLTQESTCVASPVAVVNPDGEVAVLSDSLDRWLDSSYSIEHVDHGYVYFFYNSDSLDFSVFEDQDKDGTWEAGGAMTGNLWSQKRYGDESLIIGS